MFVYQYTRTCRHLHLVLVAEKSRRVSVFYDLELAVVNCRPTLMCVAYQPTCPIVFTVRVIT